MSDIHIEYKNQNDKLYLYLNGEDITEYIRSKHINGLVSLYATNATIRTFAQDLQRDYQHIEDGLVMDGRDIGTTIFPNANVKFFIQCDLTVRAKRRYKEMKYKQDEPKNDITLGEVKHNLKQRDYLDENRQHSPLRKAKDAHVLDNTLITMNELVEQAIAIIDKVHLS